MSRNPSAPTCGLAVALPGACLAARARRAILRFGLLALVAIGALAGRASALSFNSDLVSTYEGQARGVWGWAIGGREYALVCGNTGLWVVDVSHPPLAIQIANVPSLGSGFLEVRTYGRYAYAVNQTGPLQIIDLWDPADIRTVATFQSPTIPGAHTIEIDGHYAYLSLWGVGPRDLRILDLSDPLAPVEVGHWRHPSMPPLEAGTPFAPSMTDAQAVGAPLACGAAVEPGGAGSATPGRGLAAQSLPGGREACSCASGTNAECSCSCCSGQSEPGIQAHDSYMRGNRGYVATVLGGFAVLDLTDKTHPQTLALVPYADALSHSMWLSDDGNYLFTCDERVGGHLRIWSVSDPANIQQVASFETVPGHIIHNVFVRGSLAYVAYYTDGLRVLDVSDPTRPVEVAYYDTYPGIDGGYFAGAWAAWASPVSENVLVSDLNKGLFVVAVDRSLRAGWIEGFVTDAATGSWLAGAKLRFLEAGRACETDSLGHFGLWLGQGPHTVAVEHYGYLADTTSIQLGATTQFDPELQPLPWGTLRIQVAGLDQQTHMLAGAAVNIAGLPGGRRIAGPDGIADWGQVPARDYVADIGRLGYVSTRRTFRVSPDRVPWATPVLVVPLSPGFFDNCDTDQGWLLEDPSDDATSGRWMRADPNATWRDPVEPTQPDWDADGTQFGFAFHTGYNFPSQPQEWNQVDGGHTTLTSPPFDVTSYVDPLVYYSRWFSNDTGGFPGEDPLRVELSNDDGATWALVEEVWTSQRSWTARQIRVRDLLAPSARMRLRFIAQDTGGESVVEAAVDRIGAREGTVVSVPESSAPARLSLASPDPNPAPQGRAQVTFSLPQPVARCRLELVDARGRLVEILADGPRAAGPHRVRVAPQDGSPALASGLYWIRLVADGQQATAKFVVVHP